MSKQKGRRVPPLDPTQIRRAEIVTQLATEAAWDAAEALRTLDAHVIAAGVAQHPKTGRYHTWISLYGTDLTSWYVGKDARTAHAILVAIQELFSNWSYTDDDIESMDALIAVAHEMSTDPQAVLPDAQVRDLLSRVATYGLRKN